MLALVAALLIATPEPKSPLDWHHDDWPTARARARKEGKLVAIDVWATWCHSCLSMQSYVLNAPPMAPLAGKHVWLAMDYDNPYNAAFFKKFPIDAFPTFLVIDPDKEAVVGRWVGSGTAKEMVGFFGGADRGAKDTVALGQKALAAQDYKKARAIFEPALIAAEGKGDRTRLLSGYLEALAKLDPKACAEVGLSHLPEVDDSAPGLDYAAALVACASESASAETKKAAFGAVRDRFEKVLANTALPLEADDRSGVYETLIEIYDGLGEQAKVDETAQKQLVMLEEAARTAPSPVARATFDAHRLAVYLRLKKFDEAEHMLRASEDALPHDFSTSHRLAVLYLKQGRTVEGLAAIDRALAKGYGPRRVRLYATKIELLMQKRQYVWARKVAEQAKVEIATMGTKLVRKGYLKELEAKEAAITKAEKTDGAL